MCNSPGTAETAKLVAWLEGLVILTGDLAYMHGSATDFRNCFDPVLGSLQTPLAAGSWQPRV